VHEIQNTFLIVSISVNCLGKLGGGKTAKGIKNFQSRLRGNTDLYQSLTFRRLMSTIVVVPHR